MAEDLKKVMGEYREACEIFESLAGRKIDPKINPCLSFSYMQPIIEWTKTIPPCKCGNKSSTEVQRKAFIEALWPIKGAENASLQQLVEYRLNAVWNLRTICDDCDHRSAWTEKLTLMNGIDALPIKIQRVNHHR